MAKAIRLAVIGAGSSTFSLGLVRDICLTDSLRGSTIVFMDVDAERLDIVYRLACRYADEMGANLQFEQTQNRQEALRDADFVINTALSGGHRREEAERALMNSLGYYRGLHPTEGFYHQWNLALALARDIERICPKAWLVQISNPVFDLCNLMTRETSVKVVGLCHGPFYGIREIAKVLGLDPAHISFEAPGFNHCVWMTKFRYKGEDAYPLIDAWIENESAAYWRDHEPAYYETQMSPGAIHLYQLYGLMPLGDTSRAIWPEAWWYHLDFATKQRWWGPLGGFDSDEGWSIMLQDLENHLRKIHAVADDLSGRVSDIFPPKPSGEQMVPIIDALANDVRGYFIVNVPNNGAIKGIPDEAVVEVPAIVDGMGIRPSFVGKLPQSVMLGTIWPQWLAMERRLAGFRNHDKRYLLQVLLSEQRTRSWEHAEAVLDAIMRMPGNEGMAEHFNVERSKELA